MSGRSRLPGGELRKASQRRSRRAAIVPAQIVRQWRPGDLLKWRGRAGKFHRDTGHGVEIAINERLYRARISELD